MDNKILVTRSSMPPYEEYIEAIKPLWESHRLTNMGQYHKELERQLREYLGVSEVSLMVNGHMALEMTIQAFGFPEGAEIITTPFTFVSTTHAIVRNRLIPVFCDVKAEDGTIDETKLEDLITEKTVAILPVHVYGNICNIEAIQAIADCHNLKVIYDAAHAFGAMYKGKGIGNYGNASIFSFHATKVFNTIEGGAVTFADKELYQRLYNLKNFGIRGEETVVDVGANAKMNEFAAIMGLCNLRHIENAIDDRRKLYFYYRERLSEVRGIKIFNDNPDVKANYSYFPILLQENYRMNRDELYIFLQEHGIYSRKYFYPIITNQKCYKEKYGEVDLPVAWDLSNKVLVLPFYAEMEQEKVDKILKLIC